MADPLIGGVDRSWRAVGVWAGLEDTFFFCGGGLLHGPPHGGHRPQRCLRLRSPAHGVDRSVLAEVVKDLAAQVALRVLRENAEAVLHSRSDEIGIPIEETGGRRSYEPGPASRPGEVSGTTVPLRGL